MQPADTGIGGAGRDFPTTRWSSWLAVSDPTHPAYREHLSALIERYWKPAYHYIRALRGVTIEDAKDLTQEFFATLLSRHDFQKLTPERGSFRGFLKTALKHFLASADRAVRARLPRGEARLFHFEDAESTWTTARQATPESAPEHAFDREWMRGVLVEASALLERQLASEGKSPYFDLFREYCLEPSGIGGGSASLTPPSYGDLARNHGLTEGEVRSHLWYARQRVREILQDLVTEYVSTDLNRDEELRFLLSSGGS